MVKHSAEIRRQCIVDGGGGDCSMTVRNRNLVQVGYDVAGGVEILNGCLLARIDDQATLLIAARAEIDSELRSHLGAKGGGENLDVTAFPVGENSDNRITRTVDIDNRCLDPDPGLLESSARVFAQGPRPVGRQQNDLAAVCAQEQRFFVSDLGGAEDADAAVQGFVPIADRTKPERSLVNGVLQTGELR